jgi:dihydroxyacetone kinase
MQAGAEGLLPPETRPTVPSDLNLSLIAVLKKVDEGVIRGDDVVGSVIAISQISEVIMGGTSGALYSYVLHPCASPSTRE